jgi:hypothetical protein
MLAPAKFTLGLIALVVMLTALATLPADQQARADDGEARPADEGEVYELRTYTTAEGRLPALDARFRDHTMKLFERHGMRNVMYWTPIDKPNTLIYVIAHKDRDAAKASWKGFIDDPDWKKAYAASHADGPIVTNVESVFMKKTDYSP